MFRLFEVYSKISSMCLMALITKACKTAHFRKKGTLCRMNSDIFLIYSIGIKLR